MNNFEFGNYLYELRRKSGLTQRYVAYQLGVSDKAVSKWEMGKSKPDLDKLRLLATLYDVTLNELINVQEKKKEINLNKIVLTGGPCAGKTTALNWINNYFSQRGYTVLTVPETATELISNGVTPWSCGSAYDFQTSQIKLQKTKEKIFEDAALSMDKDKILIVCDRGIMDAKAYVKDIDFKRILKDFKTNETKERDSYDAVFHLVTAAKGKKEFYTFENNKARTEGIEEAKIADDKVISAWTGHPHFRVIDNSTEFEGKLQRLIKEIAVFLGEPEPYEIERKYIIYYPNIKKLEGMSNCQKIDIVQTYLRNSDESEKRVRARGIDGDYLYYLTEKKEITKLKRVELEKKLTQDQYIKYLMDADSNLRTIHKTRYCLTENNQYFEIDIYPEWKNQAIMEIELSDENQKIDIPEFIEIVKEVTDDDNYKNYNMAKSMPKELVKRLKK